MAKAPDYMPELKGHLLDRLDGALGDGENRGDFVRQAVERELERRELGQIR